MGLDARLQYFFSSSVECDLSPRWRITDFTVSFGHFLLILDQYDFYFNTQNLSPEAGGPKCGFCQQDQKRGIAVGYATKAVCQFAKEISHILQYTNLVFKILSDPVLSCFGTINLMTESQRQMIANMNSRGNQSVLNLIFAKVYFLHSILILAMDSLSKTMVLGAHVFMCICVSKHI